MALSLEDALLAWQRQDAWETRLVAQVGDRTLVLFRREGQPAPWLELGHGRGLSAERERLRALGLRRQRWVFGRTAWGRTLDSRSDGRPELLGLQRLLRSLLDVLGDPRQAAFEVSCQREPPPDNPVLVAAIRKAAERQDEGTRRRLYAALVNATLLVPIDPLTAHLPAGEQQPLPVGEADGGPVWGAFSDWDALRQWRPAGHAFGSVHGVDFFAHAHAQGNRGVRINPEGLVGGELYPSEVAMMVDAVRRYYRTTFS